MIPLTKNKQLCKEKQNKFKRYRDRLKEAIIMPRADYVSCWLHRYSGAA